MALLEKPLACSVLERRGILEQPLAVLWRMLAVFWKGVAFFKGACSVLKGCGFFWRVLAVFWRALAVFWRGVVRVQYFICDFLSSVAIAKYNKMYNTHNNNKL